MIYCPQCQCYVDGIITSVDADGPVYECPDCFQQQEDDPRMEVVTMALLSEALAPEIYTRGADPRSLF